MEVSTEGILSEIGNISPERTPVLTLAKKLDLIVVLALRKVTTEELHELSHRLGTIDAAIRAACVRLRNGTAAPPARLPFDGMNPGSSWEGWLDVIRYHFDIGALADLVGIDEYDIASMEFLNRKYEILLHHIDVLRITITGWSDGIGALMERLFFASAAPDSVWR